MGNLWVSTSRLPRYAGTRMLGGTGGPHVIQCSCASWLSMPGMMKGHLGQFHFILELLVLPELRSKSDRQGVAFLYDQATVTNVTTERHRAQPSRRRSSPCVSMFYSEPSSTCRDLPPLDFLKTFGQSSREPPLDHDSTLCRKPDGKKRPQPDARKPLEGVTHLVCNAARRHCFGAEGHEAK